MLEVFGPEFKQSARKAFSVNWFREFANKPYGMINAMFVAASFEVGGDFWVNRGVQNVQGAARCYCILMGVVALAVYSIFLNYSDLPMDKLLVCYVIFFTVASLILSFFRYRRVPSGMSWIGIVLIAIGSIIIRFQTK